MLICLSIKPTVETVLQDRSDLLRLLMLAKLLNDLQTDTLSSQALSGISLSCYFLAELLKHRYSFFGRDSTMIPPHLRIGLDVYKMVLIEMVVHFTSLYLKLSLYIKFTYRYLLEVVLAAVEPRLAYRKCWQYFFWIVKWTWANTVRPRKSSCCPLPWKEEPSKHWDPYIYI